MAKEMHIGRVGTRLQKVFAGLDGKMDQIKDMLGAAKVMLEEAEGHMRPRSASAAGKLQDHALAVRNLLENIDNTLSVYGKEFYEEDAESATQESLVATAKAVSKDMCSYMAGCVLSEACYSLMTELKPEMAEKTTADNIANFLTTEGIDFMSHARMLEREMKRIADETDNAWQGRCTIDELCNEFPESNVPMKVALISNGHDIALEGDEEIKKYLVERGVKSGAIPPLDQNILLEACSGVFESMMEPESAEADNDLEEKNISLEEAQKLIKVAYEAGYQLRDINGNDDMSPSAFFIKLKSSPDGSNPMLDFQVDGEGLLTFMEKTGDNIGFVYDKRTPEVVSLVEHFLGIEEEVEAESEEKQEEE